MFSQRIIDLVERLENIVKAFFEVKHVEGVKVEVYHQDASDVIASWTSDEWASREKGALSRNIVFLVSESQSGCFVDSETNAWLDNSVERRWTHKSFGTLWVEPYTGEQLPIVMGLSLEKMFISLGSTTVEELIHTSDLRSFPTT